MHKSAYYIVSIIICNGFHLEVTWLRSSSTSCGGTTPSILSAVLFHTNTTSWSGQCLTSSSYRYCPGGEEGGREGEDDYDEGGRSEISYPIFQILRSPLFSSPCPLCVCAIREYRMQAFKRT